MRPLEYAGSRRVTALLAALFLALYVYFSAGQDPFGRWTHAVFHSIPGLALYALLILNLVLASVRTARGRFGRPEVSPASIREMDAFVERRAAGVSAEAMEKWLKQRGFSATSSGGTVSGRRGRLSFIPGTVLRAGIAVVMVSLALSAHLRRTDEVLLTEGQSASVLGTEVTIANIQAGLPAEFLQVGGRDTFQLQRVSAGLEAATGEKFQVTGGFPARAEGSYWRITHLGFYQPLRAGHVKSGQYLDVLPPGKGHAIKLPEGDTPLRVSLEPVKTIKKGLLTGKLFRLDTPRYRLETRGLDAPLILGPGESARVGGREISLGESALYVRVLAVHDPALWWVWAGLFIVLAGLVLMLFRFFWFEKRFDIHVNGDSALIGYSQEFYRNWGAHRFHKWMRELWVVHGSNRSV